ncbi:nuclear transport factor 2 family protein [Gammaproteobacteria bacterium]|nr:nuclear transport factor 2 family protein [Gammaproteobacteria bacterium]
MIEDIMLRYAEGIDIGDMESVGGVFSKSKMVMLDWLSRFGARGACESFSYLIIFYDAGVNGVLYLHNQYAPRIRHVTSNIIYEFNQAVNQANVLSYVTCYQTIGIGNEVIFGGRYTNSFLLDEQGWHLVSRATLGGNVGLTSHQLKTLG